MLEREVAREWRLAVEGSVWARVWAEARGKGLRRGQGVWLQCLVWAEAVVELGGLAAPGVEERWGDSREVAVLVFEFRVLEAQEALLAQVWPGLREQAAWEVPQVVWVVEALFGWAEEAQEAEEAVPEEWVLEGSLLVQVA